MQDIVREVSEGLGLPSEFTEQQKSEIVATLVSKINEQYLMYIYDDIGEEKFGLITDSAKDGEEVYLLKINELCPAHAMHLKKATEFVINEALVAMSEVSA